MKKNKETQNINKLSTTRINRKYNYEKIMQRKIINDLSKIYMYPKNRIIIEPKIKLGDHFIRPDIIVYEDNELKKALLVIEIKQYLTPKIQENTKVQILQYAIKLNAKYAVILLPTSKFVYKIKGNKLNEIAEIPIYDKENIVKELTPEELQKVKLKVKLMLRKQLKFLPLTFLLPPPISFIIAPILLAYSKNIIDIIKKDKYAITGHDFLEEQKEIILKSDINEFSDFIKSYFNIETYKEFNKYIKDLKEALRINKMEELEFYQIKTKSQILSYALNYINDTNAYNDFQGVLQNRFNELLKKQDKEVANARIEERNKIMADLSHSIKNMISTVIDPLENLKNEKEVKPVVIDNALRGANLIREIVNAMNLSFKGSIKDFHYDAVHNKSKESLSLQSLLIESIKHSVRNMFDAKYFGNFMRKYFPTKEIYTQAKSDWSLVSQSNEFNEIKKFLNKYFFKTDVFFGNAEKFIIGNEKGSAIKLHILFQELILNAVKYTTFVSKENRFFKLHFSNDEKQIRLLVENTYKPKEKTRTTGLGHVIITNFTKLLQTKPEIKKDDKVYSVEINFENFWKNKI